MINKIVSHYGINDYYKYFISKYPNSNMDKKEFKKIYKTKKLLLISLYL